MADTRCAAIEALDMISVASTSWLIDASGPTVSQSPSISFSIIQLTSMTGRSEPRPVKPDISIFYTFDIDIPSCRDTGQIFLKLPWFVLVAR